MDANNRKLKIAFVIRKFIDISMGGEPAIHFNLMEYLKKQGHFIEVYCEDSAARNVYETVFLNFSQNRDKYIERIKNSNYDFIIGGKNALQYDDLNCDLYTLHEHSEIYSQKNKFGIFYKLFRPKKQKIKREIEVLNNHKDSLFVFCSGKLKDDYCSLAGLENTKVINPYPNFLPPAGYKKEPNEIFTFGISALGFQNKGGYLALKSASLLKMSGKKFKLKIIYNKKPGFLQLLMVNLLGLKKETEFLLKMPNMHKFHSGIDCLLVPSNLESFGMMAVEGAAYGVPVIMSSNCGAAEALKDCKNVHIFKFNKFRIINLYREMKKIMEDIPTCENLIFMTQDIYNQKFESLIVSKGKEYAEK